MKLILYALLLLVITGCSAPRVESSLRYSNEQQIPAQYKEITKIIAKPSLPSPRSTTESPPQPSSSTYFIEFNQYRKSEPRDPGRLSLSPYSLDKSKIESTIGILDELFLRKVGLGGAGIIIKDLNKSINSEIIRPLDGLRSFQLGGYKLKFEAQITDDFDKIYLQFTIKF